MGSELKAEITDLEAIARIIDPHGWETCDRQTARLNEIASSGEPVDPQLYNSAASYTRDSLDKALAILALRRSEPRGDSPLAPEGAPQLGSANMHSGGEASSAPPARMPVADFLWMLLDEIDTASDIAKGDNELYRGIVERLQRRRFEVGSTDGYTVQFQPPAERSR
jgi:hypothetical protein